MKKLIPLLLLSFLFVGCNKSSEKTTESIVGAIYVGQIGSNKCAIEFISESDCKAYFTVKPNDSSYSNYVRLGNSFTFSNLYFEFVTNAGFDTKTLYIKGGYLEGDELVIDKFSMSGLNTENVFLIFERMI